MTDIDLSVVVPLYNEAESVMPLHDAINGALEPLEIEYEILFVDDGSHDETFHIACNLVGTNPHLRIIRFRRNYGQTPAMVAGIEHARGRIVITMDGDLQNDPTDIPRFLQEMESGYDIVVGWRHRRQDKLITRKVPSRIANWLIGRVTGVPIRDNGCSLKAYKASIIKNIPLYSEMHRFIPAISSLAGTRIAEIKVNHHARRFGESKYGLSRIYKVLVDLILIKLLLTSFSRPLLGFGRIAMLSLLGSAACLLLSVPAMMAETGRVGLALPGTGLLLAALAISLLFWGILGDLVYRTGDLRAEDFALLKARLYSSHVARKSRTANSDDK